MPYVLKVKKTYSDGSTMTGYFKGNPLGLFNEVTDSTTEAKQYRTKREATAALKQNYLDTRYWAVEKII